MLFICFVSYIIFAIFLVILVAKFVEKRINLCKLSLCLPGPFALPLLGNALKFFCKNEELLDRITSIISQYPSPMRIWLGTQLVVIVSDVHHAEIIMNSTKMINKDDCYKFIKVYNGEGLITSSGEKWRNDRKIICPIFVPKNIKFYSQTCMDCARKLIETIATEVNKPVFNVGKYMHRCFWDLFSEIILGLKPNSQNGQMDAILEETHEAYTVIYARITKVWLRINFIFKLTAYAQQEKKISGYFYNLIHEALAASNKRRAKQNAGDDDINNGFPPIIDLLLDLKTEHSSFGSSKEDLRGHLITFFTASEDTVTTTCSFVLLMLGMHPRIQDKVFEEVNSIMSEGDTKLTLSDLDQMRYLEMCIREAMRLFPLAPFIMRVTSEDFKMGKYSIPKDCSVLVSIFNIHRDPKHWEKPNEFYPEHFLPGTESRRHPLAYMPFSAGLRKCIGRPIAMMSMKMILALVIYNYEIETDKKFEDIKLMTDISVRTIDHTYPIRIRNRKK